MCILMKSIFENLKSGYATLKYIFVVLQNTHFIKKEKAYVFFVSKAHLSFVKANLRFWKYIFVFWKTHFDFVKWKYTFQWCLNTHASFLKKQISILAKTNVLFVKTISHRIHNEGNECWSLRGKWHLHRWKVTCIIIAI